MLSERAEAAPITVSLDASCHRCLFSFKGTSGQAVLLPAQGSYGAGDPASCPDWDAATPALCGGTRTGSTTGATSATTGTSSSSASTGGSTSTSTTGGSAPVEPPTADVRESCASARGLEGLALARLLR